MAKTTCDWTVERLPWWANETLEEGEAERVAAHLDECADCRAELAATRQAMALYAAHLPIETLLDLAEGGAGEAAGGGEPGGVSRAAAQAHLGHCAECREELALLHESRAAVAAEAGEEGGTVTAFAPRRLAAPGAGGQRRFDRRALALAASVLVAVVAAGGWLLTGRVADERGERLQALERLLDEGRTVERAAEPAAGASAEELAAAAERAAAELDAAERQIAELQGQLEVAIARAEEASRPGSVAFTTQWVAGDRMRGADPAGAAIEPPAGTREISLYVETTRAEPLRLVVEDSARRRWADLAVGQVDPGSRLRPSVILRLDLLPAGTLRLRLFAGDEEIETRLLHNER